MIIYLRRLAALLLFYTALISPALHAEQVTSLVLSSGATGTLAEITLSGAQTPQYAVRSLSHPERLVVDLSHIALAKKLDLPAGAGVVKRIRVGHPDPQSLRIVFDLAGNTHAFAPQIQQHETSSTILIEWPGELPIAPTRQDAATTSIGAKHAFEEADNLASEKTLDKDVSSNEDDRSLAVASIQDRHQTDVARQSALDILSEQHFANTQNDDSSPTKRNMPKVAREPEPIIASTRARRLASEKDPYKIVTAGMRPLIIAIDPGHGGQDTGAIGPTGRREKDVTLAIGRDLAQWINAVPGMKAYMTRDSDVFVSLPMRAEKARAAKADFFISLHADAAENNRTAAGSTVYVLSTKGASSQRARWIADKENAADFVGGAPIQHAGATLTNVLMDLAQSGHMKASEDAAQDLLDNLRSINTIHKTSVERANFVVLRTADMPALLLETAFISNPREEKRLCQSSYQHVLAVHIGKALYDFFYRQPPPGTLFAAQAAERAAATSHAVVGDNR